MQRSNMSAANMAKTVYHFLWLIENYSYAAQNWHWIGSTKLDSKGLERTSWYLALDPVKLREEGPPSLFLQRSRDDAGPETVSVNLELSIMTVDGSTLYLSEECERTFRMAETHHFKALVDMDELYVRKNIDFLPRDTLVVRCKMWKGGGGAKKVSQCTTRTQIATEKTLVLYRVGNFSALERNGTKKLQITSRLKTGCNFASALCINLANGSIVVDVESEVHKSLLRKKQLFVVDVDGNTSKCGEVDYRFKDCGEKETEMRQSFTRDFILKNKTVYLPKDELTLLCEFTLLIGSEFSEVDEVEIPKEECKGGYCITPRRIVCKAEKVSTLSIAAEKVKLRNNSKISLHSVIDDLKELYKDQLLTDVQLKTATKSFHAHKTVLCARSSVFRSMLSHDMKERNSNSIQVDDLEDETVDRLLLFLYSDSLEDLQWESALKLYYAADKYEVKSLKILCSSFLVDNLSPSTASELLLLADTHNDKELRETVEDFILQHDKDVFRSEEWKKLSKTNPQLGMETMLLKYNRDESGK